jgi:hypothetical protein
MFDFRGKDAEHAASPGYAGIGTARPSAGRISSQRCCVSTLPYSSIIDEDSHFLAVDFDPLESSTFLLFGGTNAAKWHYAALLAF